MPVGLKDEFMSEVEREERLATIAELMTLGKECFYEKDFKNAVDIFSCATHGVSSVYGDLAEQSFEAFFFYGRSLLALTRHEDRLFSSAFDKMVDRKSNQEEKREEDEDEDEDEDEEDALELAGQIFMVTLRICDKKLETLNSEIGSEIGSKSEQLKTWSLRKADVLCLLAEQQMEENKFVEAQQDLRDALGIQAEFLEESSRILAATVCNIGIAANYDGNFEEAAIHFEFSQSILKQKAAELSEKIMKIEKEYEELTKLIADVDARINDANSSAKDLKKAQKRLKKMNSSAAASAPAPAPDSAPAAVPASANKDIELFDLMSLSSNPAKESPKNSSNPAKESPETSSNPAKESPETSSNPAKESPENSSNPAKESPETSSNPAKESPETSSNPAKESPENSSNPAKESPETSSNPAKESPETNVEALTAYTEELQKQYLELELETKKLKESSENQ